MTKNFSHFDQLTFFSQTQVLMPHHFHLQQILMTMAKTICHQISIGENVFELWVKTIKEPGWILKIMGTSPARLQQKPQGRPNLCPYYD